MPTFKLKRAEKERLDRDLATPTERFWLDRWQQFLPYRRIFIVKRWEDGSFYVHVLLNRRYGGSMFGVFAPRYTLGWIKREVRRLEAAERRKRQREIRNLIGAFI